MKSIPFPAISVASLSSWIIAHRQGVLVVALTLLHLALAQGPTGWLGRTLMLVHFGLFLLWQPFIRTEAHLASHQLIAMTLVVAPMLLMFNWWLVTAWLLLLAGIIGGRVFFHTGRSLRLYYLLALAYLILMILVVAVPMAMPQEVRLDMNMVSLALYGLPVLIAIMSALPVSANDDGGDEVIDLAYSVFLILLLGVVALGSISMTLLKAEGYLPALFITMLSVAGFLLVASWLWSPKIGFSGLGAMASRYMLSVGLPLEQWLHFLADLAKQESDPSRFLNRACEGITRLLPWVTGGRWEAGVQFGAFGEKSGATTEFVQGPLTLTLYTRTALSATLIWHFNLVAQLLAEFYQAKERDREIREMAYVHAIHETGARLTHDVKNLLQSLNTLIFAAQHSQAGSDALTGLLRRQLPQIASRLNHTLDKLRSPILDKGVTRNAQSWWNDLKQRYDGSGIEFQTKGAWENLRLNENLFNTAAENLLENALGKKRAEGKIKINIEFEELDGRAALTVCDSGSAVPPHIFSDLGTRPVLSENGLGIGLYQVARAAELNNYRLAVVESRPGSVCLSLRPKHAEMDETQG